MPDLRPPRLAAGERETLLALLQYHRDSLVRKVADLDEDAARRRYVGSDTTLLWLVKHLTAAELNWVRHTFSGEGDRPIGSDLGPEDTVATVVSGYRSAWATVDAIIDGASLDDPSTLRREDDVVNLRWIVTHLLEETARHAGHADILRELIDGSTGR